MRKLVGPEGGSALDVPLQDLKFQLEGSGRTYEVEVVHLCAVPLLEELLESSWLDPEDRTRGGQGVS
jgi:hypothetical protein